MPDDVPAARPRTEQAAPAPPRRPAWQLPLDLVRGFLIGIAELVPGVSGGTIALVAGVYEQLIDSIHHVTSAVRRLVVGPDRLTAAAADLRRTDWRLVAPLLAGMAAALLTVAGVMEAFVSDSPELARGLFLGLVLCSVVVPLRMVPASSRRRSGWLDAALVLVVGAVTFAVLGLAGVADGAEGGEVSRWLVFAAAAVAICALVLPGVSGSFFLLVVGLYGVTLEAVDQLDVGYLLAFAAGAAAGLATFVPVLRYLLADHRRPTLLVMSGLLLGSVRALWPWQSTPEGRAAQDAQGPGALLAPYDPVLGPVLLAVVGAAVVGILVVVEARTRAAPTPDTAPDRG